MKAKLLNLGLILSSLIGYLEWGDNNSFLFEVEGELLFKLLTDPVSVLHPFTLIPLAGQVLLLITLLQKKPVKILSLLGLGSLSLMLLLMFFIGLMELHFKILISTLPFLAFGVFAILHHRKKDPDTKKVKYDV